MVSAQVLDFPVELQLNGVLVLTAVFCSQSTMSCALQIMLLLMAGLSGLDMWSLLLDDKVQAFDFVDGSNTSCLLAQMPVPFCKNGTSAEVSSLPTLIRPNE